MTNTHLPSLRRLRAMFGGRVGGVKRASQRHRPTFRLCLSGDDAVACSRAVLPHLYEKRPQAALLLLASKYLRGTPGGSRMSHELRLMREAIGEALSALKRPTYELGARA